ncbi:MAG: Gfo/Idh/MocA family oxidoreductase [Myxococcales bacterium]|nr:Gfo/Idh/MocA family oxidoreductase [Myxococcales bacterium]
MPERKLRAAMIGVGDITLLHYPAYRDCPDVELALLCDVDENLLARRRAEWGVTRTTTDYRAVLQDPTIDLVEVNTPHHLHKKFVLEALAAGKHVACQKPLATSLAEAEEMAAAARRGPGRFRVLENFVFYPPYVKAKELLEAGEIGEVLTIRFKLGTGLFGSRWVPLKSELWHLLEYEQGRGQAIFDDGYHKLSTAIHFLGAIEAVKAFVDCSFAYVDEPAQILWCYRDKRALGSFDIAFQPNLYTRSKYFPADERIDIVGTKGLIQLTRCTAQILDEPALILYRDGRRTLFDELETDWQASFTAGIRDFPRAIRENRDTLLTGERAVEILRFAFAIIVAGRLGREVRPAEVTDDLVREAVHG